MVTIAIIAFREFLEAFLLVGIFIGIDKKLNLRKQKEIVLATLCGIILSLALPLLVFFFGQDLNEKTTDIVEGYLLTFSGFFLVYVVFTLHTFMNAYRHKAITYAKQKMEQEIFDISLFLTIVLFIGREGFEIALLIAATSLFSVFWSNIAGLMIGFMLASCIGFITSRGYRTLPVKKVFRYTEYGIIFIGAAMVKNGISLLVFTYMHMHLDSIFSLPLKFLPGENTIIGHLLNNLFGIQQHLSLIQLVIMAMYIILVQYLFKQTKKEEQ